MREIKVIKKNEALEISQNVYEEKREELAAKSKIALRINSFLIDKLKNIVESNKLGGDYKYTNISDIIRMALKAYKDGMSLSCPAEKGIKKETSFRISKDLKIFYESLPNNSKSEIVERVISTYIKEKL